jgi:hypothetical protein
MSIGERSRPLTEIWAEQEDDFYSDRMTFQGIEVDTTTVHDLRIVVPEDFTQGGIDG